MWFLVGFFVVLVTYFVLDYYKLVTYWKKRNVKFLTPVPFLGSFASTTFGRETLADFVCRSYNSFPEERYFGVFQFNKPVLMLKDLELIKSATIKDFDSFKDHFSLFREDVDPIWGKTLFISQGDKWRDLRQTLSPVFTSSRLRKMFILMDQVAQKYMDWIKNENQGVVEWEAQNLCSKFTLDVIGTTAFGINCNSMKNPDSEFIKNGIDLVTFQGLKKMKMFLTGIPTFVLKFFNLKIVSDEVADFFRRIVGETIDVREKNNIVRPDLIHLLMEARKGRLQYEETNNESEGFAITKESELGINKTEKKYPLSDDDITAQALIFFFGGYDTTSILIVFTIYELMVNLDIQNRLRREMINKKNATYEDIQTMKYLDMVVSETLRKWPNAQFMERVSNKDFTIEPTRAHETPLTLTKGTSVWIPVFPIHRDPEYYPNPDKFDPERFSEENRNQIHPFAYLPFGTGPRNCIGSRYALLDTKIFIYHLMTNFEIVPTKKSQIPLKLCKKSMNLRTEGGMWFGLKPI